MEDLKKQTVKNEKVDLNDFKSSFELSDDEFKALKSITCQIEKVITKKGSVFHNLTIRFDGKEYSYKKQISLDQAKYEHFVRKNNFDKAKGKYVINLPYRLIKGINSIGKEYNMIQIFLSRTITINEMLKHFDLSELKDIEFNMEFVHNHKNMNVEVEEEF